VAAADIASGAPTRSDAEIASERDLRRGEAGVRELPMRARALSLVMRPTSPPLALGIVVAVALIAAETVALYPLRHIAPKLARSTCWACWWSRACGGWRSAWRLRC
jgi:hypothetical protein